MTHDTSAPHRNARVGRGRTALLVGGLLALATVAASCSGAGADEGTSTPATIDQGVKAGIMAQLSGSSTTTPK